MATRLSTREKKVMSAVTSSKKKYGELAVSLEGLINDLTDLQEVLLYRTLTSTKSDDDIRKQYEILLGNYKEALNSVDSVLGVERSSQPTSKDTYQPTPNKTNQTPIVKATAKKGV